MPKSERSHAMKKVWKIIIPILIVALLLGGGIWYFTNYQSSLTAGFL